MFLNKTFNVIEYTWYFDRLIPKYCIFGILSNLHTLIGILIATISLSVMLVYVVNFERMNIKIYFEKTKYFG